MVDINVKQREGRGTNSLNNHAETISLLPRRRNTLPPQDPRPHGPLSRSLFLHPPPLFLPLSLSFTCSRACSLFLFLSTMHFPSLPIFPSLLPSLSLPFLLSPSPSLSLSLSLPPTSTPLPYLCPLFHRRPYTNRYVVGSIAQQLTLIYLFPRPNWRLATDAKVSYLWYRLGLLIPLSGGL